MPVEIRRGTRRFAEREQGRRTQHAFSFGPVYDPERLAYGPMVCHDDHLLARGVGFATHRHEGLQIVSWVVSGAVRHDGPAEAGGAQVVPAGSVAVLDTGSGVAHAEHAVDSPEAGPCRFVQVWLRSDDDALDRAPRYDVAARGEEPGLVWLVGEGTPLPLGTAGARFGVARLALGETLALPDAARLHVFVASGALLRSSLAEPLAAGDALLVDRTGEDDVPPLTPLVAAVPTELLVWELPG